MIFANEKLFSVIHCWFPCLHFSHVRHRRGVQVSKLNQHFTVNVANFTLTRLFLSATPPASRPRVGYVLRGFAEAFMVLGNHVQVPLDLFSPQRRSRRRLSRQMRKRRRSMVEVGLARYTAMETTVSGCADYCPLGLAAGRRNPHLSACAK